MLFSIFSRKYAKLASMHIVWRFACVCVRVCRRVFARPAHKHTQRMLLLLLLYRTHPQCIVSFLGTDPRRSKVGGGCGVGSLSFRNEYGHADFPVPCSHPPSSSNHPIECGMRVRLRCVVRRVCPFCRFAKWAAIRIARSRANQYGRRRSGQRVSDDQLLLKNMNLGKIECLYDMR